MLWGSSPVWGYLLHLTLTLALVITSCFYLEGKHALAKYRNVNSQRANPSTICSDITCAKVPIHGRKFRHFKKCICVYPKTQRLWT